MAEQLFENNDGMSEECNKDTDLKDVLHCDPCKDDGIQVNAVGFCVDCNDYLCTDCYQAHTRARPLRNHVITDTDTIPKSRPKKEKSEQCQEHQNEPIKWYCTSHGTCLCDICKQINHRNCSDVKLVKDVSHGSLSSDGIKQVTVQLKQLQKDFEESLPRVKDNKEAVENRYTAVIEEVVQCLSKMKNDDIEKLKALEVTCHTTVKNIISTLNEIEKVKQNGEEDQTFVATRKAESQFRTFGKRFESVEDDNLITKYRYVCKPRSTVYGVIGTIFALKDKPAFHIENIQVDTSTDTKTCLITGMVKLSDNKIVIADHSNKKIKLLDMTRMTILPELQLDVTPRDLARIDDNIIAVTTYGKKKILFVSVTNRLTIQNTIDKSQYEFCQGIVCSNNTLIVSFNNPYQIEILNLDGTIKQVIESKVVNDIVRFDDVEHMAQGPDTNIIYLSDISSNKVSCMALDGQVISSFTHEHLKSPKGITVGKDGRIFVCSNGTNKIFEISSDLSDGQVILDEKDGIKNPCSILYDEYKVYVGSESNNSIQVFLL